MTAKRPFMWVLASVAVFVAWPAAGAAAQSNAAATQSYVQANYALVHYFAAHIRAEEAELAGVLGGVRSECPNAAAESPENVDSEQLSNEVIGTMVSTVVQHNLAPLRRFYRTVGPLQWSNGALTKAIRAYVAKGKVLYSLAVPHLCGDIKEWVASDFRTLPATTVSFDRLFMPSWVSPGDLPASLAAYETPAARKLAEQSTRLESAISEFEAREVETWGTIMNLLVLQP